MISPVPETMPPIPRSYRVTHLSRANGYVQVFDNERARGWKLALEPGQWVSPITQIAPGLRVVIDGGRDRRDRSRST